MNHDSKLKRAYELLNRMKKFTYGLYKKDGVWYIQQPNKLELTKVGVCHDFSLYAYAKLTNLGYNCHLAYITDSKVTKTHSFVIFTIGNMWYWFESAWGDYIDIHSGKGSHEDGVLEVTSIWCKKENIPEDKIAINDDVDAKKLLTMGNMTFKQYLSVVTEPFQGSEGYKFMDNLDIKAGSEGIVDNLAAGGIFAIVAILVYKLLKLADSSADTRETVKRVMPLLKKYNDKFKKSYEEALHKVDYIKKLQEQIESKLGNSCYIDDDTDDDVFEAEDTHGGVENLEQYIKSCYVKIIHHYTRKPAYGSGGNGELNMPIRYNRFIGAGTTSDNSFNLYKEITNLLKTLNTKDKYLEIDTFDHGRSCYFYTKVNMFLTKQDLDDIKKIILGEADKVEKEEKGNESFHTLYKKSLAQYEYIASTNFDVVGEEGIVSGIGNIIKGILNVNYKILSNFRATIMKGFRSLARTELQEFIDSNRLTVNKILTYNFSVLSDMQVDLPLNMVKPYKVTTEAIKNTLDVLNVKDRVDGILNSTDTLLSELKTNNTISIKKDTINLGELKSLEKVFQEEEKCFDPRSKRDTVAFIEVFQSDHCLKDTYDLLTKAMTKEYEVAGVYKSLERLYGSFDEILKQVEGGAQVSKNDLLELSGQTTTLAKLFDMYGILIHNLQRVEHNFVLVLKAIKREQNL